jgi:hypothetical protein
MTNQKEVAKQIIGFYKTTFDNSFGAVVMLQEQSEKLLYNLVDKTPWVNEEGRKVLNQWIGAYKQGRDEFKRVVDEGYTKAADLIAGV